MDGRPASRPGDEVVLSWAPSCGECAGCRRGRPATCRVLNAAIAERDAPRRDDRDVDGARRSTAAPRPAASRSGSSSPSRSRCPLGGAVPLEQAALLGCAVLTGVGAVLFAAGVEPGVVGARDRRRAASVSSSSRARGSPARRRSSSATRSRAGSTQRGRGRDARRRAGRAPRRDAGRAPGRRRLRVRRGRRPRDDRDGAPRHARRGHRGDRRAAAAGRAARSRPVRADPEGEAADRDAVRVGGPGGGASGDAGARPRGAPRPGVVARAVVLRSTR